MISKIKKPVSILLVFMMIVSLFAAVPMTVNAAPPGASLVGRYVETPGRGASNTMVFPDCDVYIKGVTGTQTIHNTSVTYSHSIEGSYDVLYFNGKEVYRGDWAVPDGIRIVSGSGTSSDPYVTEWYSTPTITWKLDEDTVIDTTKVPFDAVPTHAAPTKEPDEEYTYTFAGWSPEPVAVTDDATYTATFTAVPRPYNVNVETAEHGTVTANPAEAAKGNQVTLTAEPDAGYALSSIKAFKKNTNSQQATLTALDGSSTGGEGYDKLVDGNTNTKWGFNGGSGYIIVKADKAFRLNDYSLTTANDTNNYSGRNWKNWGIYGANFASDSEAVKNSDQWQLVTSVTNDSKLQATNFTRYDYSVNTDPEAYQYYKIEISANKGDGYTQMSELTLSGANYDVEVVLMQDSADPAKYTFEMPASNVTVKAEFEAIPTYTVTWKNEDGTILETDENVAQGTTPTYDGEPPEKAEDENNTYTFAGWDPEVTAVTGDVTYTAQFDATAKPKALISGHTISLNGDIAINFFLDPAAAGMTADQVTESNLSYTFAWADGVNAKVNVASQSGTAFTKTDDGKIKVTCNVCAAEMTCGVVASFNLDGVEATETYTVRQYADTLLQDDDDKLVDLVKKMLDYGAKAQTVFGINTSNLANAGIGYSGSGAGYDDMFAAVAAANNGKIGNNTTVSGAKFITSSLVFLSESTLRLYYKLDGASNAGMTKWNDYYYAQVKNIPAAELDTLQTFNIGGTEVKYSALDYAAAVMQSSSNDNAKALARALYWYNRAANFFFDDISSDCDHSQTAPISITFPGSCVEKRYTVSIVYCKTCGKVTSSTYRDGSVNTNRHVSIVAVPEVPATYEATGMMSHFKCRDCGKLFTDADGKSPTTEEALIIPKLEKTVDLSTVTEDTTVEDGYTITGTLQGDYKISIADGATVTLKNANITCLSNNARYAGITPLGDATILLEGENTVKGGLEDFPGVCVPEDTTLTIDGTGSLNASSNGYGCGIGGGGSTAAGNIVINGGTITANGGWGAAGIGSGDRKSCGNITITDGTITATGGTNASGIGGGYHGICQNINITGGTVTAIGGSTAAGIGSGASATCGNITIANTVTQVTAEKGGGSPNSIGAGYKGSCGTVTIGGVEGTITDSPYTYQP